jgi:hypothetical protein
VSLRDQARVLRSSEGQKGTERMYSSAPRPKKHGSRAAERKRGCTSAEYTTAGSYSEDELARRAQTAGQRDLEKRVAAAEQTLGAKRGTWSPLQGAEAVVEHELCEWEVFRFLKNQQVNLEFLGLQVRRFRERRDLLKYGEGGDTNDVAGDGVDKENNNHGEGQYLRSLLHF